MKKLILSFTILLSMHSYAVSIEQVLISNSRSITKLRELCGQEFSAHRFSAIESGVLLHTFRLKQTVFGMTDKECEVQIKVDSSAVKADGSIVYQTVYEVL